MKTNASKTCVAKRLVKLLDHASRLGWIAITVRKDKICVIPLRSRPKAFGRLPLLVLMESVDDHRRQDQCSAALLRFRRHETELAVDSLKLMTDAKGACAEVDVLPPKAQRLTLTKA